MGRIFEDVPELSTSERVARKGCSLFLLEWSELERVPGRRGVEGGRPSGRVHSAIFLPCFPILTHFYFFGSSEFVSQTPILLPGRNDFFCSMFNNDTSCYVCRSIEKIRSVYKIGIL